MNKKTATLLALFFLVGLTGGCTTPPGAAVEAAKMPVVIDTDMGFDDWMALLYLLRAPTVEVRAITIDCAGETYCPRGAANAMSLLRLAGNEDIPVFYGEEPAATLATRFPEVIRDGAAVMSVPGFNGLTGACDYTDGAATAIKTMAHDAGASGDPLTFISIGSATNIAQAIGEARAEGDEYFDVFAQGVDRIYKGGGAVGKVVDGALTNQDIPGNLNIPTIYETDNKTAAWNIYVNAPAAQTVVSSGLPVTLIPVNLSDGLPITEESWNALVGSAKTELAKFVAADILNVVNSQGGWSVAELDYWDPSVAVAAVESQLLTQRFDGETACVDVGKADTHGTVFMDVAEGASTKCAEVGSTAGTIDVYTAIDSKGFFQEFVSALNREAGPGD